MTMLGTGVDGTVLLVNNSNGMDGECNSLQALTPPVLWTVGAVRGAVFGDVTGDGNDDAIVVLANGSAVVVPALQSGALSTPMRVADGVVDALLVATDSNGDSGSGVPNVLLLSANGTASLVSLNVSTSSITVSPSQSFASVASGTGVSVGAVVTAVALDVSGDAHVDVLLVTMSGCYVVVGGADGLWSSVASAPSDAQPLCASARAVAAGDVNSDGAVDVVLCGPSGLGGGGSHVGVLLGMGSGRGSGSGLVYASSASASLGECANTRSRGFIPCAAPRPWAK